MAAAVLEGDRVVPKPGCKLRRGKGLAVVPVAMAQALAAASIDGVPAAGRDRRQDLERDRRMLKCDLYQGSEIVWTDPIARFSAARIGGRMWPAPMRWSDRNVS